MAPAAEQAANNKQQQLRSHFNNKRDLSFISTNQILIRQPAVSCRSPDQGERPGFDQSE